MDVIGQMEASFSVYGRVAQGIFQPASYFMSSGSGEGNHPLVAFDKSLLMAGIGDVNLVRVSSIVAPGIPRLAPVPLAPGSLVGVAYAKVISETPGEEIAAAVSIAHPENPSRASVIMEYSGFCRADEAEAKATLMAKEAMDNRGLNVRKIESAAVEHITETNACVIAVVVLI